MAAGGGGTVANLNVRVAADVTAALLGFSALQGAISAVVDGVKEFVSEGVQMNAFMESSQLQFTTLTGSARVAQEQLKDLFNLAAHTPFTFESVTTAARQLEVFGGAALDTHANLVMLGDAAAATGAPIEQVTFWTGRLYSQLQAGRPIGEAARWLQRMGVLSGEARQQLDTMDKAGASATEMWQAFSAAMGRFDGAMKAQEQTWQGLTSTMGDLFKLWEAQATKGLFTELSQEVREFNRVLSSDTAAQAAKGISGALEGLADPFVRLTEILTGDTEAILKNAGAWDDWHRAAFAAQQQAERNAAKWVDLKTAGEQFIRQQQQAAADIVTIAEDKLPKLTRAQEDAKKAGLSVAEAFRDESERALQYAGSIDRATRGLADYRDETARANEATANFAQEHQVAIQNMVTQEEALALMRKHVQSENTDPLADLHQREAADAIRHAQEAAKAVEKAAQDAASAREDAAREASRIEQEQAQAMRAAVSRAYVETADEAVAQYQRIANAATAPVDTLQRDIDEAINRQVRAGTEGTADAAKELDDIRRAHLATLGDLAAIDQQYAAAQDASRQADLAVAAAERDLKVALAATGGQQTLQTAVLVHNVTAAQEAADAAHDHANALAAERSQAISDTNALKGLQSQREAAASGSKGFPGGGTPFNANGWSVNPDGSLSPPTFDLRDHQLAPQRGSVSLTDFNRGVRSAEWQALHVHIEGDVYGMDDFNAKVAGAVNQGDRTGAIKLTRYATR